MPPASQGDSQSHSARALDLQEAVCSKPLLWEQRVSLTWPFPSWQEVVEYQCQSEGLVRGLLAQALVQVLAAGLVAVVLSRT